VFDHQEPRAEEIAYWVPAGANKLVDPGPIFVLPQDLRHLRHPEGDVCQRLERRHACLQYEG